MPRLSAHERDQITAQNAREFQRITPAYLGCEANSAKMIAWLEEQLGADYGKNWPYSVENFSAAFAWLNEHSVMIQRSESEENVRERQRQAKAQADKQRAETDALIEHAGRVGEWVTEQEHILKNMPMKDLRPLAAQQRDGVKRGEIERTSYRNAPASRVVAVSDRAAARTRVAAKYPTLNRNSQQFSELVLQELNS
jgi:hypothetical protein